MRDSERLSATRTHDLDAAGLAQQINAEHEGVVRAVRSALEHARRAGDLLIEAKAQAKHGKWLPWLKQHCPAVSPRTAQGYMRVARRWPELSAAMNTQHVAHLPLRQALSMLVEYTTDDAPDVDDVLSRARVGDRDLRAIGAELSRHKFLLAHPDTTFEELQDLIEAVEELQVRICELRGRAVRECGRFLNGDYGNPELWREVAMTPDGFEVFRQMCDERIVELTQ